MKKNFILLALLLVSLSAGKNIFGQLGVSSSGSFREFDEMKDRARRLRTGKSYREKTTIEVFADEKSSTPKGKMTSTREYVGTDRRYYSITNEALGKTSKVEFIAIGEKEYVREDGKKWKKYTPETEPEFGSGIGNSRGGKLIEKTTFNGKKVTVYEEETNSYSDEYEENSVTGYWFDDDGELLKTEARNLNLKTNEVSKVVTIYEYDSKIKIEAPIK